MTDQNDPKDKARTAAEDVRDDLSRKAQDMARDARETAQGLASDARTAAYDYGNGVKNRAASETSKLAEALRGAADDLQDGSIQERLIGRLASNVADAADGLRSNDIDDIGREFSSFARRNPIAFLGGAALVGFAAGRFLKATNGGRGSGPYGAASDSSSEDWNRDYPRSEAHGTAPAAGSDPVPADAEPARPITQYNSPDRPSGTPNGLHK